ncbi:hypothetical protein LCGC14_0390320 [marine sediment metagenome]|uniref:Uncharacterized protein n=1 Tax=marine sediment metagenome TaxID=412755 RepID=A0A0F9THP2_9ZZZZ
MPVKITNVDGFQVKTLVSAKSTTKKKAEAQKRLLKTHNEHLAERMTS